MDAHPRKIAVGALSHGDHSSFSYASRNEQMDALGTFVRDAFARNERVLYVAEAGRAQSVVSALGSAAARAVASGQLVIEDSRDTYMREGRFDAERMMRHYSASVEDAVSGGYAGVRIAADMGWAATALGKIDDLISYESALDTVLEARPAVVVCQYDRRIFDDFALAALKAAHKTSARPNPIHKSPHLCVERAYDPHGLSVAGEIDISNRSPFRQALVDLASSPLEHIVVDLTAVRYIDAASIAALAGAAVQNRAQAMHLRLSKELSHIFGLVCPTLPSVLTIEEVE